MNEKEKEVIKKFFDDPFFNFIIDLKNETKRLNMAIEMINVDIRSIERRLEKVKK